MALVTEQGNAWNNLANAVVLQAVQDYEYCISDKPMFIGKEKVSKEEIRLFARTQQLVGIDVNAILDRIDRMYHMEFRPYVLNNLKGILDISKLARKQKGKAAWTWIADHSPYKCPFCGGYLREGLKRDGNAGYIVCSHCNLNMRIPKEAE